MLIALVTAHRSQTFASIENIIYYSNIKFACRTNTGAEILITNQNFCPKPTTTGFAASLFYGFASTMCSKYLKKIPKRN